MVHKNVLVFFVVLLAPIYIEGHNSEIRKELYQPINVPSPSPINVNKSSVKEIKTLTPLTLNNGLIEFLNITNKGNIIEIYPKPTDQTYISGGILGFNVYKLVKIRLYITQNPKGRSGNTIDGLGGPLEPTVIYRNVKYPTFEEALKRSDGIFILGFCVIPIAPFQLKFFPFQITTLSGIIKKPGSSAELFGAFLYIWFDHILKFKEYYAYRGSYLDIDSGKQYYGATYAIASPQIHGLSFLQFKAFKNVLGNNNKPIEAPAPIFPQGSRTVYHTKGVLQLFHLY